MTRLIFSFLVCGAIAASAAAQNGFIEGKVTDAATGVPISGVRVDAYVILADLLPRLLAGATTDASGRYRIESPGGTSPLLMRTQNTLGYVDQVYRAMNCAPCRLINGTQFTLAPGATLTGHDFALVRGGAIEGRVLNTHGEPVSGSVVVYDSGDAEVLRATLDAEGRYKTSPVIPPGNYFAHTSTKGHVDQLHDGLPCEPSCTASAGTAIQVIADTSAAVDFTLLPMATLRYALKDALTGWPLRYTFYLSLYDSQRRLAGQGLWSGNATPEIRAVTGTYYLGVEPSVAEFGFKWIVWPNTECPTENLSACVQAAGSPIALTNDRLTEIEVLVPRRGASIHGRVLDRNGAPFAGAMIRILGANKPFAYVTGADGTYIISGLAPGQYRVSVESRSAEHLDPPLSDPVTLAGTDAATVDIRLRPASVVAVTVKSRRDGSILSNATVLLRNAATGESTSGGVRNAAGVITLGPLAAGTYYLQANAEKHQSVIYDGKVCGTTCAVESGTPIVLQDGASFAATVALPALPVIRGRVTDASGVQPVAGATIRAFLGSTGGSATSAADGSYVIDLPREGDAAIVVIANGYARQVYPGIDCHTCEPRATVRASIDGEVTLDLRLTRASELRARIFDAHTGAPIPDAHLRVDGDNTVATTPLNGFYSKGAILGRADYYVSAWRFGYMRQYWNGVECDNCNEAPAGATPVRGANGDPVLLTFRLRRPAYPVTFRFVDAATNAPLSGVGVDLFLYLGGLSLPRSASTSDANGMLTVAVPIDTYYAKSWNSAGRVDGLPGGVACGEGCNVAVGESFSVKTTPGAAVTIALHRVAAADISPNSGAIAGGNEATIYGGGFGAGTTVTIGGKAAEVLAITPSELRVRVPSGAAGTAEVEVRTSGGATATLRNGYQYDATCATLTVTPKRPGRLSLQVDVSSSATPVIQWFRGTRGAGPLVAVGNRNELGIPDVEGSYIARVTAPCRDIEIKFDYPLPRNRAVRR